MDKKSIIILPITLCDKFINKVLEKQLPYKINEQLQLQGLRFKTAIHSHSLYLRTKGLINQELKILFEPQFNNENKTFYFSTFKIIAQQNGILANLINWTAKTRISDLVQSALLDKINAELSRILNNNIRNTNKYKLNDHGELSFTIIDYKVLKISSDKGNMKLLLKVECDLEYSAI